MNDEIVLTKDGQELLRCKSTHYLEAFVQDHYPLDDCLWVSIYGEDFINYLDYRGEGRDVTSF